MIEGLGHRVVEADPPISNDEAQEIFRTLMASHAAQTIRPHPKKGGLPEEGEVERVVAATALKGAPIQASAVFMDQERMHALVRLIASFAPTPDVLLPTAVWTSLHKHAGPT